MDYETYSSLVNLGSFTGALIGLEHLSYRAGKAIAKYFSPKTPIEKQEEPVIPLRTELMRNFEIPKRIYQKHVIRQGDINSARRRIPINVKFERLD